jgi:POT family proton-dependent oligopeptide transporter
MNITPADQAIAQRGHPKGLYVLFATEFWERFSYYGMRAIFVLFMTNKLLFDKAYASNIYGSYTGLVYLTPLIGGYVADRYWGNRKSIFVGGLLMALGQFILFACASLPQGAGTASLLLWTGLAFLIFGNGFFKPNISTMVGQLYPETDNSRKDSAYTIFYMGINAGAFVAPLVCGYLGENVDFKWGFLAAGIGMLISLVIFYFTKDRYVVSHSGEPLGVGANKLKDTSISETGETGFSNKQIATLIISIIAAVSIIYFVLKVDFWGSAIYGMTLCLPFAILTDRSLSKIERDRLWVIVIIMIFVIFFWMCFEQAGASLTFFADEQTDRTILGWQMPASYFQSFNAGFIVLLAPIFAVLWGRLAKKGLEPPAPMKQAMGLGFLALGFLFIAFGTSDNPAIKVSILWLTGLYFLHTIGELFLSPIGLSMVNKLTPGRFTSLMMGIWFMAIATGNKLAGTMSSLYPEEQRLVATYTADHVKVNNNAINWDEIKYPNLNEAGISNLELTKKNDKSEKPDSLVALSFQETVQVVDTLKSKRIIPPQLTSEAEQDLEKKGEKKPGYIYSVNKDGSEAYLLKRTSEKGKYNVVLQQWDLKPARPKFLGITIDNLHTYFMIFVGFAGAAAIILFFLSFRLKKLMHGLK